jgi:vitamin B12 transporter
MRPIFTLSFLLFSLLVSSQTTIIRGKVAEKNKTPVLGANVQLLDTYDGATVDAEGNFKFETTETGDYVLQATCLGYDTFTQKITLRGGEILVNPILKEGFNELKVVTISAGAFEASDEKKVTVLKPLDIVTTASAGGDTYGALKTLPGAQVSSGDQSGIFVRGGTGSEAQTFIDGMLVRNPFFAASPDYAARGRFNPFLFKGTVFSTGGYSAQYGQGMSSALILDTQDFPDRSAGNLAVSSVGLGFGQQKLWPKQGRAAGININYTNLAPYFWLFPQVPKFSRKPEYIGTEGFYRQKTGKNGMLKFYGYFNAGKVGLSIDTPEGPFAFSTNNRNFYTNLTWSGLIFNSWKLSAGTSYSNDWNNIQSSFNAGYIQPDTFKFKDDLAQVRLVATHYFGRLTALRIGAEHQISKDGYENPRYGNAAIKDQYTAAFAESDLYITTRLVARVGLRAEYSSLLAHANAAPRVSIAYKMNNTGQFSFAWGYFYQKGDSLLRWQTQYRSTPGFQLAEHYILNYQYIQNDRTLRIEGFYKRYDHLVRTLGTPDNGGKGYAQGLELFYRDKKSLKYVDYWVSYSWLDTKRQFWWYPSEVQPTFAANHAATLVLKKFIPKISTSLSMTYSYSTGRPYYNPNQPVSAFLTDRTPAYQNLSLNASYLTTIHKAFTVFVIGLQNVLGNEQVFGYRYSNDGTKRSALTPSAKRFFFIGAFMSWGTDRRQEVLDNQN